MKSLVTRKKDFEAMVFYVPRGNELVYPDSIYIGFSSSSYWKALYSTGNRAEDKNILISVDEYFGSYANIIPTKEQRIRRQK